MEFNIAELEEIKLCINTMISERIKYECFEIGKGSQSH